MAAVAAIATVNRQIVED